MTPVGHYAISATVGLTAWRLGLPPIAAAVLVIAVHTGTDYVFNEFYQWGEGMTLKIKMAAIMFPAVIMLAIGTALSRCWYATLLFGITGILPDVADTIASKYGHRILHWNTPVQMQSFKSTVLTEGCAALLASLLIGLVL